MRDHLRHWVLLDLAKFREDIDYYASTAHKIDNRDGTYGLGFDLRSMPEDMILAASDTMRAALTAGTMEVVQPLPTAEKTRVVIYPRQLSDLIAEFGRYDLITPEAWAKWDAHQAEWRKRYLVDEVAIYVHHDGSIENPNELNLKGTPWESYRRKSA